ncbi:MAG TPA: hypothetical protein PLW01_12885 [Agitococcus sp.]|nr:hypothetical protein [Agitococcus sp.]
MMKKIIIAASLSSLCSAQTLWAMTALTDEELATVDGQALMNLSYIAPGDAANFETANSIGFYKLGFEAKVEANLNLKKLQLGCGGVNGAGGCDIDIDNLSLSGLGNAPASKTNSAADRAARVQSDAVLENPFFEFAIKNPNSASTREVVGFRVSAERAIGLLTTGTENSTTPNGINAISGFMRIQSDSTGYVYGKANTLARRFEVTPNANYVVDGVPVTYNNQVFGRIDSGVGAIYDFKTTGGGMNVPAMNNIPFIRPGIVINESRKSALPLAATLTVPPIKSDYRGVYPSAGTVVYHNPTETPINWTFNVPQEARAEGGPLDAQITGCSGGFGCTLGSIAGVNVGDFLQNNFLKATITGISANVTIQQDLGYVHYLPINSPFYLSLQAQDMRWPGSKSIPNPERTRVDGSTDFSQPATVTDTAKRGWWMSFADPIDLGSVDPVQAVDIAPLFPQLAQSLTTYITANPASMTFTGLVNAILGTGDINIDAGTVNLSGSPLSLTLRDLQLSGQSFTPNCYGGLTFC